MKRQEKIHKGFIVVTALATLVVGAYAQNAAQQQQQQLQQQQMLRLQTMTQRMTQIQERAQNLVQNLDRKMAQTRTQARTETQAKVEAQIRALKQMGEGTAKMAGEMKGNLDEWREMYRNRELFQDKAMTKDMNQVHNRLEKAANELDEMLKVMERLANRLKING